MIVSVKTQHLHLDGQKGTFAKREQTWLSLSSSNLGKGKNLCLERQLAPVIRRMEQADIIGKRIESNLSQQGMSAHLGIFLFYKHSGGCIWNKCWQSVQKKRTIHSLGQDPGPNSWLNISNSLIQISLQAEGWKREQGGTALLG